MRSYVSLRAPLVRGVLERREDDEELIGAFVYDSFSAIREPATFPPPVSFKVTPMCNSNRASRIKSLKIIIHKPKQMRRSRGVL